MGKPAHIRVMLAKGQSRTSQSGSVVGTIFLRDQEIGYDDTWMRTVFASSNESFSASVSFYLAEVTDPEAFQLVHVFSSSTKTPTMQSASFSNPFDTEPLIECRLASEEEGTACVLGSAELILSGNS